MNPEKQRIAIAEACGRGDYGTRMNGWHDDQIKGLPDYLHDLNAMHGAERVLNDKERAKFVMMLHFSTDGDLTASLENPVDRTFYIFPVLHATAAQRAEAFLRTIGKWEDDK